MIVVYGYGSGRLQKPEYVMGLSVYLFYYAEKVLGIITNGFIAFISKWGSIYAVNVLGAIKLAHTAWIGQRSIKSINAGAYELLYNRGLL